MATKIETYNEANKDEYPIKYSKDAPFSDEDILKAEHLNFITANLNSLIDLLTWNGEITKTSAKTTPASSAQMIDLT